MGCRALYRQILLASSRQKMWTQVKLNNGTSHPYGFGWELGSFRGRKLVHHGEGMPGFRAEFARLGRPADDYCPGES